MRPSVGLITTTQRRGASKTLVGVNGPRHGAGAISPKRCHALANRFLAEVQGVIATSDIYGEAHDLLFGGYFANLKQYEQPNDFGAGLGLRQLPRPNPLQIFVEPGILYGFFRLWLRKQGIDPDTVVRQDWEYRGEDGNTERKLLTNCDDV